MTRIVVIWTSLLVACSSAFAQPAIWIDLTPEGPVTAPWVSTSAPSSLVPFGIRWFKISIGNPGVSRAINYLDIRTISAPLPISNVFTKIALYRLNANMSGTNVGTNFGGGPGFNGQLSYGAACPARLSQQPLLPDGLNFSGQNGDSLTAGVYFLAVMDSSVSPPAALPPGFWGIPSSSAYDGSFAVDIAYRNVGALGPAILSSVISPFAPMPGANTTLTVTYGPQCSAPDSNTGLMATADLRPVGGSAAIALRRDFIDDRRYSVSFPAPQTPGDYAIPVRAVSMSGGITESTVMLHVTGAAAPVKISQFTAYTGIGGSFPRYTYVELYNAGDIPASLAGWSLQASSETRIDWVTVPMGRAVIAPRSYFLVQFLNPDRPNPQGVYLDSEPDVVSPTTGFGPTTGKLALLRLGEPLTLNDPQIGAFQPYLVDMVAFDGFGPAEGERIPELTRFAPALVYQRKCGGELDTGSNNADFVQQVFTPSLARNSASPPNFHAPTVGAVSVSPANGLSPFPVTLTAFAGSCSPGASIASVTVDLSSVGGASRIPLRDDGLSGDGPAGDGVFGVANVAISAPPGSYFLPVEAVDSNGIRSSDSAYVTINIPPPPNDECANAVGIFGEGRFPFTNVSATSSLPTSACSPFGAIGQDVWFRWIPAETGAYSIGTCDSSVDYSMIVQIFTGENGCPLEGQLSIGCSRFSPSCAQNRGYSRVEQALVHAGATYYIRIGTVGTVRSTGLGQLTIERLPLRASGAAVPSIIHELDSAVFAVSVGAAAGTSIQSVTVDGSSLNAGSPPLVLHDDGVGADLVAGDSVYSGAMPTTVGAGAVSIPYVVVDSAGSSVSGPMDVRVISSPGACCLSGGCTIRTALDCIRAGGSYVGPGSTCSGWARYSIAPGGSPYEDISARGVRLESDSNCEDCTERVGIGFDFRFFSTIRNSMWVASDGFVNFGDARYLNAGNYDLPDSRTPHEAIYAFWDNYTTTASGNGDVYVLTEGPPGSRRCIISWQNLQQYLTPRGTNSSFQLVLYERTNEIELRFGAIANPLTPQSSGFEPNGATVGFENVDGSVFFAIPYNAVGPGNVSFHIRVDSFVPSPCTCSTDRNSDGSVDPDDLADAISCYFDSDCGFDFNGDGVKDPDDVSSFIVAYFRLGGCR